MASPFDVLLAESAHLGAVLTTAQLEAYERYANLLIERNTSVNLTAITGLADIARKHVLDSLTACAVRRWSGSERVVDVGTGAGFPGLALRIAFPASRVTLIESVTKKARFLEEVVANLKLDGVEVRNARAEDVEARDRGVYDVGLARAVGSLGADFEYLLPYLKVGGEAIVWKGRVDPELPGARNALHELGGELVSVTPTSALGLAAQLPGRHLVVARKIRATPPRYPRRAAEARRHPW